MLSAAAAAFAAAGRPPPAASSAVLHANLLQPPARHPRAAPACTCLCLQIFRRMLAAYVDAVSNPFYTVGTPLASPRFDASIRTIATSLGALT